MSDLLNTCVNLLKSNYNLILTGAPGTGKTFLARKVAEALGATLENGRCEMVQFHPSMDYTDFVEGLRPVSPEGSSEIRFQRINGIFKDFCLKALKNFVDSGKSRTVIKVERTIEELYSLLRSDIKDGVADKIPLKTGGYMMPVVSVNGNIRLRAIDEDGKPSTVEYIVSLNRIQKLAKRFKSIKDLEGIRNITDEIRAVIGGCNASAYWALLHLLYEEYSKHIVKSNEEVKLQNYVFIIDEINRGEVSKILGELFFSIDPGYRGEKGLVKTQYHNLIEEGDGFEGGFFIPENVYIIGTMNDIDRSVESMDFAMRRRFAWKEITVESQMDMLDNDEAWGGAKPAADILEELKNRMRNLNNAIIDKYESDRLSEYDLIGLTSAYQVGPAYFLKYRLYNDFDKLWDFHLNGLLNEYLRGSVNMVDKMKRLRIAYNDTSKREDNRL